MLQVTPERVVIATVFENRPPYLQEVATLYRTLIAEGGMLAQARKVAYCIGAPDPSLLRGLAALEVSVREVEPVDRRCPHANKLRMLEQPGDVDYLVALDTDIAIAGDFSPWIPGEAIAAKPVDGDPLTLDDWVLLFDHFGLSLPRARYLTHFQVTETIPYFNSGVVIIPGHLIGVLRQTWSKFVADLLDVYVRLPRIEPHRFFTDQFALALALEAAGLPHRALPLELNFPTHMPIHPVYQPDLISPYILHHHHRCSPGMGELLSCDHAGPNAVIARINRSLSRGSLSPASTAPEQLTSPNFDNRQFWNERYRTNPELGSGIGSRNEFLILKRDLMQGIVDECRPASVLDVGCGDLEIVRQLRYEGNYTGIDISDVVVERNRRIKPGWTFISGDFTELIDSGDLSYDMVMCLDVIIHQHNFQRYRDLVRKLVLATQRVGFVTGYQAIPRPGFRSHITAFHEPISVTLADVGATDIRVIGSYRDTAVISFSPVVSRKY